MLAICESGPACRYAELFSWSRSRLPKTKKAPVGVIRLGLLLLLEMVGVPGFEPGTSSSRTKRATELRHTPTDELIDYNGGFGIVGGEFWESTSFSRRKLGRTAEKRTIR